MSSPSSLTSRRWGGAIALILLLAAWSRSAHASDDPRLSAELNAGSRVLEVHGLTFHPFSPKSTLSVNGNDESSKMLIATDLRLGVRTGPWTVGVHESIGLADWGSGHAQQKGDILLRPSGSALTSLTALYVGYVVRRGDFGARLEAIGGGEYTSLGMERPSFPDTKVKSVSAVRIVLAPRVTFERYFDGFAVGIFAQTNALDAGNVSVGLAVTGFMSARSNRR